MGIDRLKPMTPEWEARQRRHYHNSFMGYARMMQMNAQSIMNSDTTTLEAKSIATKIEFLALELSVALKERIDR